MFTLLEKNFKYFFNQQNVLHFLFTHIFKRFLWNYYIYNFKEYFWKKKIMQISEKSYFVQKNIFILNFIVKVLGLIADFLFIKNFAKFFIYIQVLEISFL